jgi:hypothetical protein
MRHNHMPGDPNRTAVATAAPSRPSWAATLSTMLFIAAGLIGLACFSFYANRRDRRLEPADRAGAGIIVRSELVLVWLPETRTGLVQRLSRSRALQSHEELRRALEREENRDLWYALTTRTEQVDGEFADLTVIRRPYDDALHFVEFLDVLATVGGNPPRRPDADFSKANVRLIAEESPNRDPREIMADLLGHRSLFTSPMPSRGARRSH